MDWKRALAILAVAVLSFWAARMLVKIHEDMGVAGAALGLAVVAFVFWTASRKR